jgi:hypothetical protein
MTIVTRSMSKSTKNTTNKPTKFKVNIDFNEASLAWRSNKRSVGNGCFEYTSYEKPNSSGDRRSPPELAVRRLSALLPQRTRRATQRYMP